MINPRREKFEKIKQSLKEAQDYLLIGIDVSKDKHNACFMISAGRILNRKFVFENTQKGYEFFLKKIHEYKEAIRPEEIIVGLETTGNYMVALAEFLSKNDIFVVMVSSFIAKRNRDTLDLSWNKNDIKDAWNVTDCMKQGKILYFAYPNNPFGDMKRLMTIYSRLSRERGICKIRLQNNVLCMTFPEFTEVYPEVAELVPMTILERYTLPENICKVSEEAFMKDVVKNSGPSARKLKMKAIYKLAHESVGSREENLSLEWETKFIIQRIKEIRKIQEGLLNQIKDLAKDCADYERLQTIPGVGPVLAATILTEIGDIDNFRSIRQVLKLAGLDLARIQSGQFTGEARISRRGKPLLRSAVYQAALVAARNDSALRTKFLHMISKHNAGKGQKKKFLMALGCKILRIAFTLMKNKESYRNDYGGSAPSINSENVALAH